MPRQETLRIFQTTKIGSVSATTAVLVRTVLEANPRGVGDLLREWPGRRQGQHRMPHNFRNPNHSKTYDTRH